MDIILALLPWQVIWGLQLNLKEKVGVGIAMSMGMLAGIVAFVKCSVLPSVNGPNFLCKDPVSSHPKLSLTL
jgi:rhodopsin domain-containing protein